VTKPLSRTSLGAPVAKEGGDGDATQFDALLSEWTYGLGRTMSFTSDAKARWAKEWLGWENYRRFWSQAVRSVLRTVPRSPYAVQAEIEGGQGKVVVDALDPDGKFIHTLQFTGSVTSPEGRKTALGFRQTGQGRYEAEFEAGEVGVYRVQGAFEGAHGEKGYLSEDVPVSYAAEYRDLKTNVSLLNQIHERTGGRKLAVDTPVYAAFSRSTGVPMPLWPYLLAAILGLFWIDVFIRRVAVDWGEAMRKFAVSLRPSRAPRPQEVPAAILALKKRKEEVRAVQLAPASSPVDLGAGAPAAPASGPAPRPQAEASPPPKAPAPASEYMNRLLEAKKKAQQK
jgi:hypothetical protein